MPSFAAHASYRAPSFLGPGFDPLPLLRRLMVLPLRLRLLEMINPLEHAHGPLHTLRVGLMQDCDALRPLINREVRQLWEMIQEARLRILVRSVERRRILLLGDISPAQLLLDRLPDLGMLQRLLDFGIEAINCRGGRLGPCFLGEIVSNCSFRFRLRGRSNVLIV